ncbi:hypothetical protein K505DRAFT_323666 [Melanomma pulvis-pyrius CBS 109.77]|uniref:Uncharacterized protein n=1 Tax=Melanomma pulvis-pyrius CBS 109.77 TaxID=1314802 RepID=A0A6A6XHT4_9PLEO|nr:hypothetical protein K505DRAFT_323666 [Melanomma pulvis-pyrius CBS 109.77]
MVFVRYGVQIPITPPTERYALSHINSHLRMDLTSLEIVISQAIGQELYRVNDVAATGSRIPSTRARCRALKSARDVFQVAGPHMAILGATYNWVAVVDWILDVWHRDGYPRTTYITDPALQRLYVVAAFVHILAASSLYNNDLAFARLLAYGDALLLDAQRNARNRPGGANLEERRLLERGDNWGDSLGPGPDWYWENMSRVEWVVGLRVRTRGRGAEWFGPLGGSSA